MNGQIKFTAYIAFAVVCLAWGSNFLAIRVAIETLPTLLLSGTRFVIAGGLMFIICLALRQRLPRRRAEWQRHTLIGTLMIGIGVVAVVWSEHYMSSGWAALLVSTGPFWMVLTEMLRRNQEQITTSKMIGIGTGFVGVLLLIAPKLGGQSFDLMFLLGVLALQVACIAWSLGTVWSKYGAFEAGPLMASAIQMLAGGTVTTLVGLLAGEAGHFHFTPRTFAAFVFLTLVGSLCAYTAYIYSLSQLSTITVSLYDYIVPGIAVLLGWLILHEQVGWRTILSLALITSGVAFDKLFGRQFSAPVPVEAIQEET